MNEPAESEQNQPDIYDEIRREMLDKQKAERERKQKSVGELFHQPKGFHEWAREQNGQPADIYEWIETQNQTKQKGKKTNE
jgi:hypothetical protein